MPYILQYKIVCNISANCEHICEIEIDDEEYAEYQASKAEHNDDGYHWLVEHAAEPEHLNPEVFEYDCVKLD